MKVGKRSWFLSVLVVLACLGLGVVLSTRPEPALPLGLIERPYRMPAQPRSLFSRLVPTTPGWAWLWRVKDAVLGPRQVVNIGASAFAVGDWSETALARLGLGEPEYSGVDGVKLWLRSEEDLGRLRAALLRSAENELLSSPRMSTATGTEACLFSGSMVVANGRTNQAGLSLDISARVRRDTTDLTTIITVSETISNSIASEVGSHTASALAVRTNLEAAARVRLPPGVGLFLLDAGPEKPDRRHIGVILSATVPPPKRR